MAASRRNTPEAVEPQVDDDVPNDGVRTEPDGPNDSYSDQEGKSAPPAGYLPGVGFLDGRGGVTGPSVTTVSQAPADEKSGSEQPAENPLEGRTDVEGVDDQTTLNVEHH